MAADLNTLPGRFLRLRPSPVTWANPPSPVPAETVPAPARLQCNFINGCQYIMLSPLPIIPVKWSTISQNPPATNWPRINP